MGDPSRIRIQAWLIACAALFASGLAQPAQAARHATPAKHHAEVAPAKPAAAKAAPTQPPPKPVPVPEVQTGTLPPPPPAQLLIAVKQAPPFAMKTPDGNWHGIAVALWQGIAQDLGLRYRLIETDLNTALMGVAAGEFDAAVGAFTVTPAREERVDFTHPYYTTGLGIAVQKHGAGFLGWLAVAERIFSWPFLSVVISLLVLLLISGVLMWLFERRRNPQFGGHWWRGVGDGMWWSAVTMTTVGYGDKAPVTLGGRVVGLLWMFAALVVLASFTAAITSALTVGTIKGTVGSFNDLRGVRVGALRDSSGADTMQQQGYVPRLFPDVKAGLSAVADGKLDAFVYDAPLLIYTAKHDFPRRIDVLPDRFIRQDYGFALRENSPLRESLNVALLRRIRSDSWRAEVERYLGTEEADASLP